MTTLSHYLQAERADDTEPASFYRHQHVAPPLPEHVALSYVEPADVELSRDAVVRQLTTYF